MKQLVVGLVGLSGVGKSTALKKLALELQFQHVQASALIKQAREHLSKASVSSDELRQAHIGDNQTLLIEGFKITRDPNASLIILDGHTVVDTPAGLVRIEPEVFKSLGITHLIFMSEVPETIVKRRDQDKTRNRPHRSLDELAQQQDAAVLAAFNISLQLGIPLIVARGSEALLSAVNSAINSQSPSTPFTTR